MLPQRIVPRGYACLKRTRHLLIFVKIKVLNGSALLVKFKMNLAFTKQLVIQTVRITLTVITLDLKYLMLN